MEVSEKVRERKLEREMAMGLRAGARLSPLLFGESRAPAARRRICCQRRAPLVGAFCVLSLGALSALSSPFLSSHPLLPTFWSTATKQTSIRSINSVRMDSSSQVPSIVVYVTVPNKDAGKKLAESIIQEKLAACVNRVPGVESVYWWDGKVQTDSEELLIIKTRESLLGSLTEHIKANHEYEVPEVIALPITGGNEEYLAWIKNSTRDV